jgi:undecaprenyl-diphosphatase
MTASGERASISDMIFPILAFYCRDEPFLPARSASLRQPILSRHKKSTVSRWTGDIDPIFMSIAAVSGVAFVALALLVAVHPGPFFFDRPISVAVQSVNFSPFQPFHDFISAFSGFVGIGVGAAVIAATFLLMRRATAFVAFSALYSLIYNGVDLLIRRPRPTGLAHTTPHLMGHSFPSGHAGFFVWLAVLAVVLLARRLPRPLYLTSWALAVLFALAAGLSRIYVGAHWPSDVLGGLLVGVSWTALSLSLGRLTDPILGRTANQ